jgi:hypothetical protein
MRTRTTITRLITAAAICGGLVLAGCGPTSSGGGGAAAQPSSATASGPAAAQSARARDSAAALASGPAAAEAKTDIKGLEAACAPADPKTGKPVADPVAVLLGSSAARHTFARCEELPRRDWPKAVSCLLTWGSKAHKALAAIPGYTSQLRVVFAEQVLNYCAAYAKGKPAKKPVLS